MKHKPSAVLFFAAAVFTAGMPAHAATLTESFADITTLTGSGWVLTNNSTPGGSSTWSQGNSFVFVAHSGGWSEYIGASYTAGGSPGSVSLWLISPTLNFLSGDTIRFHTRTAPFSNFPDSLELRVSSNGSSTNVGATTTSVGDFTTVLWSINPGLLPRGYPEDWTEYVAPIPFTGSGRFAFRYVVDDVDTQGLYIGIDTVSVGGGVAEVPEPSAFALSLLGVAGLAGWRQRAQNKF